MFFYSLNDISPKLLINFISGYCVKLTQKKLILKALRTTSKKLLTGKLFDELIRPYFDCA